MIKAFISHSSRQKDFAIKLCNLIGRDFCIIDCYDFEPAFRSIDEIYKKIDDCTVFVLLISRESLKSKWVAQEVSAAAQKFAPSQYDRFWPYIIDYDLKLEECPAWIRTKVCFNLHTFTSPELLRLDIEQKFRRIIWKENPDIKIRETGLIGRQEELGQFEQIRYSMSGQNLRALIISGRQGVGKDAFAKQCLCKLGRPSEMEPCRISLDVKNGLEDFIIQLNLILIQYDDTQMKSYLAGSYQGKLDVAISMLNQLFDMQQVIFLDDNMACVLPDKSVPKWVADIVSDDRLNKQLALFIKSRLTPNSYIVSELPRLEHIHINPLSKLDRKKLFYSLAQSYHLDSGFRDSDVDFFVERLLESPSQILEAVKVISQHGVVKAKTDIAKLIEIGDERSKPLIDHFKNNSLSLNVLCILARFEFLDFDALEEIFEEELESLHNAISDLMVRGVVSTFGPSDEYIRLDHYLCDYIRRNHIRLPKDLEVIVGEVIEKRIVNANITKDVSLYFYDLQQKIMKQQYASDSFLVPSVLIKAVIEAYNERNYNLVISICEKIRNDGHFWNDDVDRELLYWYCLSLCRTLKDDARNKDKFWESVNQIGGADRDFLKGFFFRYDEQYTRAEKFFKQALEKNNNMDRAKRELVTVLLEQGKFDDALKWAKENYENDKGENTYHIYAYFRCLVRKSNLTSSDREQIRILMEQVRESYSDKKEELYAAMEISYATYIDRKPPLEMLSFIKERVNAFPKSVNVSRAANEYRKRQELR